MLIFIAMIRFDHQPMMKILIFIFYSKKKVKSQKLYLTTMEYFSRNILKVIEAFFDKMELI